MAWRGDSDHRPWGSRPRRPASRRARRGHPRRAPCAIGHASADGSAPRSSAAGRQPGVAVLETHAARQVRRLARVVQQVEQRERDVGLVLLEHRAGQRARLHGGLGLGGARAQLTQRAQLPLAVHLLRRLRHGREHAADAGPLDGLVGDRTVRDDEMRLLQEPAPVDQQVQIVAPRRRLAAVRGLDHRADHVPDLRPAFGGRLAHRPRVLVAQHRPIRVVVELDELRAPPQQHRRIGCAATGRPSSAAPATSSRRGRAASTPSRPRASPPPSRCRLRTDPSGRRYRWSYGSSGPIPYVFDRTEEGLARSNQGLPRVGILPLLRWDRPLG